MKIFKELYDYREMIISFVRKDLRGRYKGSVLGFLWTFVNPLLQLLVYTIVFSTIMRFGDIDKYYLFLFVTLIPWLFFSTSLTSGCMSVLVQKDMLKKIYFPREVLPVAQVTSCFMNMLFSFVVIFAVLIISGSEINFLALLYLPVVMIVEYIFAMGITLIASAVTVYFRDLEHILGIVAMAWMYMTPVIYGMEQVPEEFRGWFILNPMTSIIVSYRDILYYAKIPEMDTLGISFVMGIIILFVGFIVFGKLKKHFAEEL